MTAPLMPLPMMQQQYGAVGGMPQYGAIAGQGGYATGTPTDPNNPLSAQTLLSQPSAQQTQYQGQLAGDITGLQNAPNQAALEQQQFQALAGESNPIFQQNLQEVGQSAAQYGRLNSGLTTSQLGDVASNYNQYLANAGQQLAAQGAQQQFQNQATTAGLTGNALGQQAGLDQQQYGNLVGQQQFQNQQSQQAFQNNYDTNALLGQIGQQYGTAGSQIPGIAGQIGQTGQQNLASGGNTLAQAFQNPYLLGQNPYQPYQSAPNQSASN